MKEEIILVHLRLPADKDANAEAELPVFAVG